MAYEQVGYFVVVSMYFLVAIGILFPIIYWIKPKYSGIVQIIASWFQTSLVMIGYVAFLWLASTDMAKTNLLVVIGGLILFFAGVFIVLDALFVIRTGVLIPLEHLADTGIYASARHPIYIGTSLMLFGLSICFWSYFAFMESILITILLVLLTFSEEKELALRFGKRYAGYQKKVSKFNVFSGLVRKYKDLKV